MAAKFKFYRVAVEGATTDGRKIERRWLTEIAKNYNPEKYGARIFIEHIRGINPDYGFRCLGDVIAVKAENVEIDGETKLALFAQIAPTPEFIAFTKAKQKIYTSIEVNPDFADSGEAYLVGLGATDSPASLGTEVLEFAAQHPEANPFTTRKQHPSNLFSAAVPCEIELEEEEGPSLFARIRTLLGVKSASDDHQFADVRQAIEAVAQVAADTQREAAHLREHYTALTQKQDAQQTALASLSQRIDHTGASDPSRPPATGGNGAVATDC